MAELFWEDEFEWLEPVSEMDEEESEVELVPVYEPERLFGNQIRFAIQTVRDLRHARKLYKENGGLISPTA